MRWRHSNGGSVGLWLATDEYLVGLGWRLMTQTRIPVVAFFGRPVSTGLSVLRFDYSASYVD